MKRRVLTLRNVWLKVHLYLGLVSGLILVLVGSTGSIIAFETNLDQLLNPGLLTTEAKGEYHPLNEIAATARAALPDNGSDAFCVLAPESRGGVFVINYFYDATGPEGEPQDTFFQAFIDPYTGEILGHRDGHMNLIRLIYDLHSMLLLGEAGEIAVGIIGLTLLTSILTGIYLWWPKYGGFRKALTIKWDGGKPRLIYDLHKMSGICAGIVLFVIGFSGVCMIFPQYVEPAVDFFSPISAWADGLRSTPQSGVLPIPPGQALAIAKRTFPDAELKWIDIPLTADGIYLVNLRSQDEVTKSFGLSQVAVDQYSGEILAAADPKRFSAGETFLAWQFPLHNGEAFGLVGRWIVFFSGFVPLVLFITGLLIWLRKRRARKAPRSATGVDLSYSSVDRR